MTEELPEHLNGHLVLGRAEPGSGHLDLSCGFCDFECDTIGGMTDHILIFLHHTSSADLRGAMFDMTAEEDSWPYTTKDGRVLYRWRKTIDPA